MTEIFMGVKIWLIFVRHDRQRIASF